VHVEAFSLEPLLHQTESGIQIVWVRVQARRYDWFNAGIACCIDPEFLKPARSPRTL
jgi:hypothetical protein